MDIPFDSLTYAIAAVTVAAAYVSFGISTFGAALFTVPILSFLFPLEFVLPVSVLLDVAASLALGARFTRDSDKSELLLMTPFALAGAVLGVTLLVALPKQATIAGIGVFLLVYSAWSLQQGEAVSRVSRGWGPVAGITGGTMGTLFGVGAPPYAIYLTRRIADRSVLRATLSNMVLLSTSIRALVFLAGGLMLADRLIAFALLVPFALAGLWIGNRLQGKLSRAALLRFVSALLFLIGLSLLARAAIDG